MEKLILRGVMWGADKIPDHYFEKIPGGYYKAKDANGKPIKVTGKGEKVSDTGSSNGSSNGDMKQKRSSRRYSDDEYEGSDRRHRKDDRDDGYRSDGHGRRRDTRKSYDGAENDNYDLANGRPRRQRSRARRERSPDAGDKYWYGDGHIGQSREERDADVRMNGRPPYNHEPPRREKGPLDQPPAGLGIATGAAAAGAPYDAPPSSAGGMPQQQPNAATRSTSTLRGGMATGYVPYSNIYGGPTYSPQPGSNAPPQSDIGSVQPNSMNQVAPPVAPQYQQQGYHQNPFAQEAPPGSQPGYMPDPYYSARQYNEQYGQHKEYDDRYDGNRSDTERRHSRSPHRRRSRRDEHDRYDDEDSRDGRNRVRSERRDDDRGNSQGRGKSRIEEMFGTNVGKNVGKNVDTTQRGLGYGAVGALAGGLIGSEFGKGALPSAVGAVVGAVGANAFQARERYVDPRRNNTKPPPPNPSYMSGSGSGSSQMRMPQPPPRRRAAARSGRDGGYDRRRAPDGAYYSE